MKHLLDIKEKNKKNILRTIHKYKNISKKQIAIKLNLSASVLTKLCNELKSEKLIVELKKAESTCVGRKETLMGINYNIHHIIGVFITHKETVVILSNLEPVILATTTFPTDPDPDKYRDNLVGQIQSILTENDLFNNNILGIGVSIKGVTDGERSISGIWDTKPEFKYYMQNVLDITVILDNDVRCSALLENFYTGAKDFLLIKYVEAGIGGAIMKDEQLAYGDSLRIADIGHIIVDPNQRSCNVCQRKGCLESIISYERIISDLKADFSIESYPILYKICNGDLDNITLDTIFIAAENGSLHIDTLLKKIVNIFSIALINTHSIVDINFVILNGEIFKYQVFIDYLKSFITKYESANFWDKIQISDRQEYPLSAAILILNKLLF